MPLNENPTSLEQAPAPGGEVEMVDVHEADIASLDEALKNAQAAEQQIPDEDSDSSTDANPESSTTQEPTGQSAVAKAPAGVAAPGAEPSKPAPVGATRTYTQEEVQGLIAENERRKNEGDQKELFIQHRGNELGNLRAANNTLRQQLAASREQLANGLADREPLQIINDQKQIERIDQELEKLDTQEARATRIVEAQTFFVRHVDPQKVSPDDMADAMRADGIDERFIAEFKANPWEWTSPEALVLWGKRAQDRKEFTAKFTEADGDRRLLAKHVLYLNEELTKARARPGQVVGNLQRALNSGPSVTSASTSSRVTAQDLDPTKMSVAELDAALKNAGMQ